MTDTSSGPSLSVVIPVLNEARDLGRLLDEVLGQAPPPGGFEVLVADGGSTDGSRDIVMAAARAWRNLRLLNNPGRRSSAGRNVGARASQGAYILFLDGHCQLPRNDYLVRVVDIFASSGADCLCRPQPLDRLADGAWAQAGSMARHSWLGHHPGSDIYGAEPGFTDPHSAGAAYTRACFERLEGYDELFDACEDVEFNHRVSRAGFRSYRHPDLAVFYRPRPGPWGLFRQLLRYGRGRARLVARHRIVPWPLILVAGAVIVVPVAMATWDLRLAAVWIGAVGLSWLVVSLVESVRLYGFRPGALRLVLSFAAIHGGLTLGFCRGLLEYSRYRGPRRE